MAATARYFARAAPLALLSLPLYGAHTLTEAMVFNEARARTASQAAAEILDLSAHDISHDFLQKVY